MRMRKDLVHLKHLNDGTHGLCCPYCGAWATTLRGRMRIGPKRLRHQARSCDHCGMGFINVYHGGRVIRVIPGRSDK